MALSDRVLFFRTLSTSLRAGLPVEQALSLQAAQGPAALRVLTNRAVQAVRRGASLYDALRRSQADRPVFHDADLAMVQAGERSGKLAECLDSLATQLEDSQRLWRQVSSKFAYPLFLIAMGMLSGPIISLFVANKTAPLVQEMLKLALLAGAGMALYMGRDRPAVSRVLYGVARWVPGLGGIVRKVQLHRMATILAFSYRAGVDLASAFRMAREAVGDPRLKAAMSVASVATERGTEAAVALGRSADLFPPTFLSLLKTGELTGTLDEVLLKQAGYWQDELAVQSQLFARFVGLAIFLVSAVSLLGPLMHIQSQQLEGLSDVLGTGRP